MQPCFGGLAIKGLIGSKLFTGGCVYLVRLTCLLWEDCVNWLQVLGICFSRILRLVLGCRHFIKCFKNSFPINLLEILMKVWSKIWNIFWCSRGTKHYWSVYILILKCWNQVQLCVLHFMTSVCSVRDWFSLLKGENK